MALILKRTGDWWFFTLLPLIVFTIIGVLLYVNNKEIPLSLLIAQQMYFYSLILSSTEIGLRFRLNAELEENKFKDTWFAFLVIILSAILLTVSYLVQDIFNQFPKIFLGISIICMLGSIWLSNQNEYSGIPNFGKQKKEELEEFSNRVENTIGPYKEVKI